MMLAGTSTCLPSESVKVRISALADADDEVASFEPADELQPAARHPAPSASATARAHAKTFVFFIPFSFRITERLGSYTHTAAQTLR